MGVRNAVLLTGATGLLGGEIIQALADDGVEVYAMIRASTPAIAMHRLRERLAQSGARVQPGVHAVCGDLAVAGLGLSADDRELLAGRCGRVIHAAGATAFRDAALCHKINVVGLRRLIGVLRQWPAVPHLYHMSSAAVTTSPAGCLIDESMPMAGSSNGYVRSKRRAEQIVGECPIPHTILRPSIAMGDTIKDRRLIRQILWVVPACQKLGWVPWHPQYRLDIVPASFVAGAVAQLIRRTPRQDCYYISAGPDHAVTCAEIEQQLLSMGSQWNVPFLRRKQRGRSDRRLLRAISYYRPFVSSDVVYDNRRLAAELDGKLPAIRRFTDYCAELIAHITVAEAVAESANP